MSGRPEDQNATMRSRQFPDGASVADLQVFLRELEARMAPLSPEDGYPEVSVNDRNEIQFMTCVVERRPAGKAAR